jgi:hypothetical protein
MITGVRAIRQDSLGGPEVLRVVEIPAPEPTGARRRRGREPGGLEDARDEAIDHTKQGGKLVLTIA